MTNDELEAAGLYECDCGRVYESERALVFCCATEWDKPAFLRSYELGNN